MYLRSLADLSLESVVCRMLLQLKDLGHKFRLFTIQMAANEAVMSSPTSCLLLDMKWVNYINLPCRWQKCRVFNVPVY